MRGKDEQQLDVFSYVSPEQRVPQDHPLRSLRALTDEALRDLQPRFNKLYAKTGRPSIAPEKLLRALLLQALYSVPRAPARWGHRRKLLPSCAPAGTRAESALGRALHRGWNATGSVGKCEELSAQGC